MGVRRALLRSGSKGACNDVLKEVFNTIGRTVTIATVIREAEPGEAKSLSALALRSKAHWGYSDEFIDSCKAELTYHSCHIESNSFEFVVAERQKIIAGFYALTLVEETAFELDALFVEPDHIGEGIGRLLIEHALKTVAIRGGEGLIIQGDPNAEGFYLAAGAELIGSRASESIPGRMLPLFKISVQQPRTHNVRE